MDFVGKAFSAIIRNFVVDVLLENRSVFDQKIIQKIRKIF